MSRAKPVSERNALDFYATPQPLADAICRDLAARRSWAFVVEPSAGHGTFVLAAHSCFPDAEIVAVDVSPDRMPALDRAGADAVLISDWLQIASLPTDGPTLIVGNPPYREAEEHIRHALTLMRDGDVLAFLLRLNLLGSRSRLGLWASSPLADVIPVVPRPSFTGGGSDATEYAVFVWEKGHTGPARLSQPLCWEKPRAASVSPGTGER